jgi:tRNA threonylcarbamoyladenosine biosynthesis protein TsaB
LALSYPNLKLLALDTATEACSAALLTGGEVQARCEFTSHGHSDLILNMLDALLAEGGIPLSSLDALAFGRGPGSFTGVRIGASVAQGIAFAYDLPVLPISSLAALAQMSGEKKVLAAIDARMGEVYWGVYEQGTDSLVALKGVEQVCPPQAVPLVEGDDWFGAGTGWREYSDKLYSRLEKRVGRWEAEHYPHASATARLGAVAFARGEAVVAELALPVYLRNSVAKKPLSCKSKHSFQLSGLNVIDERPC